MSDSTQFWIFRLRDILHSIERIEDTVVGISPESYAENEDLQDIVERRFQIIGEAARKVPEEIRAKYSHVPWSKMIGLRNFIVHEYNAIDRSIVWETIAIHFPNIKPALQKIVEENKE